jgi:hypothetical protein
MRKRKFFNECVYEINMSTKENEQKVRVIQKIHSIVSACGDDEHGVCYEFDTQIEIKNRAHWYILY